MTCTSISKFDLSTLEYAKYLVKNLLKSLLHINLVLGVSDSAGDSALNPFFQVESLPENCTWSVTTIGKAHRQLRALSQLHGGICSPCNRICTNLKKTNRFITWSRFRGWLSWLKSTAAKLPPRPKRGKSLDCQSGRSSASALRPAILRKAKSSVQVLFFLSFSFLSGFINFIIN